MASEQKDKANDDTLLKDLLTLGALLGGAYLTGKQIDKAVVNNNRKETALEEFDRQDLSWWDREQLKSFYKDHDFYVTKFPQTDKHIFPLAVRILYKLFHFHGQKRLDSNLAMEIIHDCEELHRIGRQYKISPINLNWPYWLLVADSRTPRFTLFGHPYQYRFVQRPNWNLQTFLMGEESLEETMEWIDQVDQLRDIAQLSKFPGIIKAGLFGIDSTKKIDFCYYRKAGWGKLVDRTEVDENQKNLFTVWNTIQDSHLVAVIYDIPYKPELLPGIDTLDSEDCSWPKNEIAIDPNININPNEINVIRRCKFKSETQLEDEFDWPDVGYEKNPRNEGGEHHGKEYKNIPVKGISGISFDTDYKNGVIQITKKGYLCKIISIPDTLRIIQSTTERPDKPEYNSISFNLRSHCLLTPVNPKDIETFRTELRKVKLKRIKIKEGEIELG